MNKTIKFVFGAFLGGFIGASTVILLAPGSGDETRTAIKERFDHLVDEFKMAMQERRQELETELKEYENLS